MASAGYPSTPLWPATSGRPRSIPGLSARLVEEPGPHGFSEMLYEFTSAAANNGSGFEGLATTRRSGILGTGMAMLLSRYIPIIAPLALAGVAGGEAGDPGDGRIAARR